MPTTPFPPFSVTSDDNQDPGYAVLSRLVASSERARDLVLADVDTTMLRMTLNVSQGKLIVAPAIEMAIIFICPHYSEKHLECCVARKRNSHFSSQKFLRAGPGASVRSRLARVSIVISCTLHMSSQLAGRHSACVCIVGRY